MENSDDRKPDEQKENNAGNDRQLIHIDFENTAVGQLVRETRRTLTNVVTQQAANMERIIFRIPPLVLPSVEEVNGRHRRLFFPTEEKKDSTNGQNSNSDPESSSEEKKSPSMRKSGSSE